MQKVNLSRLNNEMKEVRSRIAEARKELSNAGRLFSFKVFEGTTDADIKKFKDECLKRRGAMLDLMASMRDDTRYLCALRAILDKANRKCGVLDLLREIAALQSQRDIHALMGGLMQTWAMDDASDAETCGSLKDAKFYKGAFTSDDRTYTIRVGIVEEDDARKAMAEAKRLDGEIRRLQDELASLNQRKHVQMPSREEFLAGRAAK